MKFRTPPQWPPVPDGWIPDPGWHPEADWPSAPKDWDFWVNDYGVPVEGPPGLYGARVRRVSWTRRALVGGGALLAFLVGVGWAVQDRRSSSRLPRCWRCPRRPSP